MTRCYSSRIGSSGKWTFPGGGVDKGEGPLVAAGREVREELGIMISEGDVGKYSDWIHHPRGFLYRYYRVRLGNKPEIIAQWEIGDWMWVKWSEVEQYLDEEEWERMQGRIG